MNENAPDGIHAVHGNSVHQTLKALRAAVTDEAEYAREWCTERSGATALEGDRQCLCSRLLELDVDSKLIRETFVTLLGYTTQETVRSEYARLHMAAPNHAAALQLIERALNDQARR